MVKHYWTGNIIDGNPIRSETYEGNRKKLEKEKKK